MNAREALLLLGVLTGIAGLAVAFVPGLAAALGIPADVSTVLAVLAIVGGVVRARTWFRHEEGAGRPRERERPIGIRAPGDEFDEMIARAPTQPSRGGNTRLIMIRQSLREAAIETLVTYQGHSEESAQRALRNGTWTGDEYAVEFFTSPDGAGGSLSESVTSTFYGERPYARRARRAAREIDRLSGRAHGR